MSQAPINQGNSKDLKPIDLKVGNCSGAKFYIKETTSGLILRKEFIGNTKKLKDQFNWLDSHNEFSFIPKVSNPIESVDSFSYEMNYYENAKNAHEGLEGIDEKLFLQILTSIEQLKREKDDVSHEQVDFYLKHKLDKKLLQCFQNHKGRSLTDKNLIQDKEYQSIAELIQELNSCKEILKYGKNSEIHGDLTLENILIDEEKVLFIDPNGENTISTIEVELAKLFQSLNSSYEDLSLGKIKIPDILNLEDHFLFTFLKEYILRNYGDSGLLRVYFHELIHLARLLPYKQINLGHQYDDFLDLFIIRSSEFLKMVKA